MKSLPNDQYYVGIVCALDVEMAAIMGMLCEEHAPIEQVDRHDHNTYLAGRMHEHNIMIACLPAGIDGVVSAAAVGKDITRTFPQMRLILLVGIAGGIPHLSKHVDIRLGDIVVSQPSGAFGGVVQYDKGKSNVDGFERKGALNAPPPMILSAVNLLKSRKRLGQSQILKNLALLHSNHPAMVGYDRPSSQHDRIYQASFHHPPGNSTCHDCPAEHTISREQRRNEIEPHTHYGIIASGNSVIKDGMIRDRIRDDCGAIAFEMEAAGLMHDLPCIVIRGICDYADSHKNDMWHGYAAATAAAYARELLFYLPAKSVPHQLPMNQVTDCIKEQFRAEQQRREEETKTREAIDCLRALKTSPFEEFKNINPERVPGTCRWVLDDPRFKRWHESSQGELLWISADPGAGKSTLAKALIDTELKTSTSHTVCYFFFKENDKQERLVTALCAILFQIFEDQRSLLEHAMTKWRNQADKAFQEIDQLSQILLSVASDAKGKNIVCVIDALDECHEADRRRLIDLLSSFYLDLKTTQTQCQTTAQTESKWLKFLVTSRPYDDIASGFAPIESLFQEIRLRGEDENSAIQQEINIVLKAKIEALAQRRKLGHTKKQQLQQQLLGMESRTYLWLQLVFGSIEATFQNSLRPDKQEIELLPTSLEDAYERILSRATQQWRILKTILELVIGARHPLDLEEMAAALGIATRVHGASSTEGKISPEYLRDNIQGWCGLFIFLDHSKIYLIHQTAKEFLLARDDSVIMEGKWKHSLRLTSCELTLAEACLGWLWLENPMQYYACQNNASMSRAAETGIPFDEWEYFNHPTSTNVSKCRQFTVYAQKYWEDHLHQAKGDIHNKLVLSAFRLYARTLGLFRYLGDKFQLREGTHPYTRHLHEIMIEHAALNGHYLLLTRLLSVQENEQGHDMLRAKTNALTYAVLCGKVKAVKILLHHGASPNDQFRGITCQSGLQWREEILYHRSVFDNTSLEGALAAGVIPEEVEGGTPLHVAAYKGEERIMEMLLRKEGVHVNSCAWTWRITPLHLAALAGHASIVALLLDHGADAQAKCVNGKTPYQIAVMLNRATAISTFMAQLALENTTQSGAESTCKFEHRSRLRSIVPSLQNSNNGKTARQSSTFTFAVKVAAEAGGKSLVQHLLNAWDQKISGREAFGRATRVTTTLGANSASLLASDVEISPTETPSSSTKFIAAVLYDQSQVVKKFLDTDKLTDKTMRLASEIACKPGHADVFEVLFIHQPRIFARDQLIDIVGYSDSRPTQKLAWAGLFPCMRPDCEPLATLRHQIVQCGVIPRSFLDAKDLPHNRAIIEDLGICEIQSNTAAHSSIRVETNREGEWFLLRNVSDEELSKVVNESSANEARSRACPVSEN